MQPSQQAYYLQTLGIVQYVPKESVALVDEAPAVAFNDRSLDVQKKLLSTAKLSM